CALIVGSHWAGIRDAAAVVWVDQCCPTCIGMAVCDSSWAPEIPRFMKVAALTFVYNESVNLPIWIKYYGSNFGEKNLFVADRESDDGSTANLGEVNRVVLPRNAFDDVKRASFM